MGSGVLCFGFCSGGSCGGGGSSSSSMQQTAAISCSGTHPCSYNSNRAVGAMPRPPGGSNPQGAEGGPEPPREPPPPWMRSVAERRRTFEGGASSSMSGTGGERTARGPAAASVFGPPAQGAGSSGEGGRAFLRSRPDIAATSSTAAEDRPAGEAPGWGSGGKTWTKRHGCWVQIDRVLGLTWKDYCFNVGKAMITALRHDLKRELAGIMDTSGWVAADDLRKIGTVSEVAGGYLNANEMWAIIQEENLKKVRFDLSVGGGGQQGTYWIRAVQG